MTPLERIRAGRFASDREAADTWIAYAANPGTGPLDPVVSPEFAADIARYGFVAASRRDAVRTSWARCG